MHVLVFLLPLIVLYEIGSVWVLRETDPLVARQLLHRFFDHFGVVSVYLPGAALVVVLLTWHLVSRDKTRLRPGILGLMLAESIGWTFPLLMLSMVVAPTVALLQGNPASADIRQAPWQTQLTLSVGAGLYEELIFRMTLMALVHGLMVDLLGLKDITGRIWAVALSAVAFTAFHHIGAPMSTLLDPNQTLPYLVPGLYFAVLYLFRGFGIVVGVHALFDVVVLLILPTLAGGSA